MTYVIYENREKKKTILEIIKLSTHIHEHQQLELADWIDSAQQLRAALQLYALSLRWHECFLTGFIS